MTTFVRIVCGIVALFGSSLFAHAEEPKLPDVKTYDKLVIDSLREVHNKGADLYNASKDFSGAFRLYQGALAAVRPLLAHRPEAQKLIDAGFTAADKETDTARKAYILHETIEGVRKYLKVAIGERKPDEKPMEKKPEEKKPIEKKPEEKKPIEKKPEENKPAITLPVAPAPRPAKP
jgi:hypothetical protein